MKVFGKIRDLLGAILILACGLVFVTPVFAADEVPDYRIQVSPARFDLEFDPGKTYTEKVKVQNTGKEEFDFTLSVAPYSVSNEEYISNFSEQTAYTDLAAWVKLSKTEGTIAPGGTMEVTVTITVPKDVPAGGQYAAILAQIVDKASDDSTGVAITKQAGILIFSNVDGVTRKEAKIEDVKISSFLFKPPVMATSTISNSGNTHIEATYILQVYPLFGSEEVYTNEENPERHLILPETRRFNTVTWEGSPQLGLFRVRQTVRVLDEERIIEKIVFLCPIWFLFIIILIAFCVIFWIISRIRNRNKE